MESRCSPTELKEQILDVLLDIEGPGSFASGGPIPNPPNPGLYINDHGTLGMPLSEHDANVIISKSKQSPFGKGNETRVDTSVRRSWELDATQILTRNPLWDATMRDLITTVHKELALTCGAQDVSAQLYKLLLYEPGAFFKPHQDTEKVPGMFGTLVVSLPSLHQGGGLVLCHNEETIGFKTSNFSEFGSSYAAWYSNVTHEVKPVVSGYRLVLTYNLVRLKNGQAYIPLAVTDQKERLLPVLDLWESSLEGGKTLLPPYLIHKLEHQYTQASLQMARLQGRDLSQVQFLQTVCDTIGFGLYLAQMERMIVKDDYGGDSEYERDANLRHIQELDGRKLIESLHLQEDYTLEEFDADDDDHDESEHEGYTGNEGAPATYWYRDTVGSIRIPCFSNPALLVTILIYHACRWLSSFPRAEQTIFFSRALVHMKAYIVTCESSDHLLKRIQSNRTDFSDLSR